MTKNRIYTLLSIAALTLAAAATPVAHAQTYTDLYNLDGTHGATPAFPQILAQGRDGNLYGTTLDGGPRGLGVVFRVTAGGFPRVLHDFEGFDGAYPYSGLTLGTDGNLYGATAMGGSNHSGTIFKITPTGSLSTLYAFTGGTDGASPYTPPVEGIDGNFYGTTGAGTAYKITPSGGFTLLGSVPGGASYGPLLQAADGAFYSTTVNGGSLGYGTVFRMTTGGTVKTIYNFDITHGSAPFAPLIQPSDGNFYGTASTGGATGFGVLFKLTPAGAITILHNFDTIYAPFAGLVQATDDNFYDAVSADGKAGVYGTIFKFTTDGTYSALYDFAAAGGSLPRSTPMQHTNGIIYGLTEEGGTDNLGVAYSFDLGLAPFVRLLPTAGSVGKVIGFLGQGFTGTTAVSFNGIAATFKVDSDTTSRRLFRAESRPEWSRSQRRAASSTATSRFG
jgi:uncharacterized repeat protein (TIGR03803 family)